MTLKTGNKRKKKMKWTSLKLKTSVLKVHQKILYQEVKRQPREWEKFTKTCI